MKVRSLLFGMLCMLALGASLASCSDDDDDSLDDGGSKVFPLSLQPHSNQALHFTDNFASPCIFHEHGDVFLLILYV